MKTGMKNRDATIMEWVGPRCSMPGIIRSMSGIMEQKSMSGMFILTFVNFDKDFPAMYPKARCPTANMKLSPWGYGVSAVSSVLLSYCALFFGPF